MLLFVYTLISADTRTRRQKINPFVAQSMPTWPGVCLVASIASIPDSLGELVQMRFATALGACVDFDTTARNESPS